MVLRSLAGEQAVIRAQRRGGEDRSGSEQPPGQQPRAQSQLPHTHALRCSMRGAALGQPAHPVNEVEQHQHRIEHVQAAQNAVQPVAVHAGGKDGRHEAGRQHPEAKQADPARIPKAQGAVFQRLP